jgi:hypothetical protein
LLPKAFGLTFAVPIKKRAFSKEKEITKVSNYLVGNNKITTFAALSKKRNKFFRIIALRV